MLYSDTSVLREISNLESSVRSRDGFKTAFMTQGEESEVHGFIMNHPKSTFCHYPGWAKVMQEAYGKRMHFLLARTEDDVLVGVVPVVQLSSWILGRQWVALPYQDYGGPLASSPEAETVLVEELKRAATAEGCRLDIRSAHPLASYPVPVNEKVAMTLSLEGLTLEAYWKKLETNTRNHVRKAEKSGVTLKHGGLDQLDAFYSVFCLNSRNLGSPVHSRSFFESLLENVPGSEIVTAWRNGRCIGGLVRIRFRDTLSIPWAATAKKERVHCPNYAMYHESISTAFREGCRIVDFGRSNRGEGTYRYKTNWLAEATPLPWYQFDAKGRLFDEVAHPQSYAKLRLASRLWSHLPLPLANWLGPYLRPSLAA